MYLYVNKQNKLPVYGEGYASNWLMVWFIDFFYIFQSTLRVLFEYHIAIFWYSIHDFVSHFCETSWCAALCVFFRKFIYAAKIKWSFFEKFYKFSFKKKGNKITNISRIIYDNENKSFQEQWNSYPWMINEILTSWIISTKKYLHSYFSSQAQLSSSIIKNSD